MPIPLRVITYAILAVAFLFTPIATRAQATAEVDYSTLIQLGLTEFNAGQWAQAREHFRQAQALDPGARTLRAIGFASFELADYADTVATLTQALAETRRPLSAEQVTATQALLTRAEAFVGRVQLAMTPASATVRVDGAPAARLDDTIILSAGTHRLEFSADGYAPETREVEMTVRATTQLSVELRSTNEATEPEEIDEPEPARSRTWKTPVGWSLVGVGGASGLIAILTGVRGQGIHDDLADRCPGGVCPADASGDISRGRALVNASTATTMLMVASGAAGAVLLILDRGHREEEDTTPTIEAAAAPGGFSIGMRGQF